MRTGKGLLRAGVAMGLGAALMLQPSTGVFAAGGSGFDASKMPPALRARVSGLADLALSADASGAAQSATRPRSFFPHDDECALTRGGNIKVNQNCVNVTDANLQGRAQAQNETSIAVDPTDSRRVVSGFNDYRRGDGTCGTSYSQDGGRTWNDSTAPNGFTRGSGGNIQGGDFTFPGGTAAREYWQGGGDTSVAWDSRGNAYLSCQIFNRGLGTTAIPDVSSGFVIFRSTQNGGASWDFPGRYVIVNNDLAATGAFFEDKQFLTVDNSTSSPFRDRLYVTWTEFSATAGYIYVASSADYGETFTTKKLISPNTTTAVCPAPFNPGAGCDNNQFSQPFTAPDGTLYVVWANYNATAGHQSGDGDAGGDGGVGNVGGFASGNAATAVTAIDNHEQILLVKSTDGGMTFSAPIKVGDFFDLPDCAAYQGGQDAGRECVPEKGASMNSVFRAANYPVGAVNPRKPSQVVVSYPSYISKNSNESNGCVPQGFSGFGLGLYDGVKTAGACNNKVVLSVSNDSGGSFTGTTQNVRTLPTAVETNAQRKADQWFHWLAFTNRGKLVISYYDRGYGNDETTGNSDITVASTTDLTGFDFDTKRVTSASMPPPTQFPDAQGAGTFWGDYAGLAVRGDSALPLWSDTRDPDVFTCPGTATPGHPPQLCGATEANGLVANDEDIFVDSIDLP